MPSADHGPLPLDPAAFGEPASAGPVVLLQTHIAWVYLVGEWAFKIKKPATFDFLDFSTLEGRRAASEDEVRLNRRLCPDMGYRLIPVVEGSAGPRVVRDGATTGPVIDWCVWMRRLPADRMLDRLLDNGAVTPADAERIADRLADFYLPQRGTIMPGGSGDLEAVRFNVEENLREGLAMPPEVLAPGALELIANRARHFLKKHGEIIRRRAREGFVVDGHGDLRAENICLLADGTPLLFDCIEFNTRFRINDSALDAAFLAMDFDSHGRTDLSAAFLARYRERCDRDLPAKLLDFHLGYRAFVKAKVAAWIARDDRVAEAERAKATAQSRDLFDLAVRYALRNQAVVIVFCGPAGSGKSTLARELARRLACAHVATDALRDEVVPRGAPPEERYTKEASEAVYRLLAGRVELLARMGKVVVADGTFLTPHRRGRIARLAHGVGAVSVIVWPDCPPAVIERHLADRLNRQDLQGSEAGAAVSRDQQSAFVIPDRTSDSAFDVIVRADTGGEPAAAHASVWESALRALGALTTR